MLDVVGILLAAGHGTRMKTNRPKVCHEILGRSMLEWSIKSFIDAQIKVLVVVISPLQLETNKLLNGLLEKYKSEIKIFPVEQEKALGTGHAVQRAISFLENNAAPRINADSQVVVGFADIPGTSASFYKKLLRHSLENGYEATIASFVSKDPAGYGRVFTDPATDFFIQIKEQKDCTEFELKNDACNSGLLCGKFSIFQKYIFKLTDKNEAKELYLTEMPNIMISDGKRVGVFRDFDPSELQGVNTQEQLCSVTHFFQEKIIKVWQQKGVHFLKPESIYLTDDVKFGTDVVVEPFVCLSGNRFIGDGARIKSGTFLE